MPVAETEPLRPAGAAEFWKGAFMGLLEDGLRKTGIEEEKISLLAEKMISNTSMMI